MNKPNEQFELTVSDIDLIENALRGYHQTHPKRAKDIQELLGKLHNQKIWYRPKSKNYVGG